MQSTPPFLISSNGKSFVAGVVKLLQGFAIGIGRYQ